MALSMDFGFGCFVESWSAATMTLQSCHGVHASIWTPACYRHLGYRAWQEVHFRLELLVWAYRTLC